MAQYFHFMCPECGFDDKESGALASEKQIYCGLCAGDGGDNVRLSMWPEGTSCPYTKAKTYLKAQKKISGETIK